MRRWCVVWRTRRLMCGGWENGHRRVMELLELKHLHIVELGDSAATQGGSGTGALRRAGGGVVETCAIHSPGRQIHDPTGEDSRL